MLQFVDSDHGWLVVQTGPPAMGASGISTTNNGGRTWDFNHSPGEVGVTAVDFISATTGWAVAQFSLLHTGDGGSSWHTVGEPASLLTEVDFVDANRGFGITADHTLEATTDGGAHWSPVKLPGPAQAVCFDTSALGWVAGLRPTVSGTVYGAIASVYRTTDGGKSWSASYQSPDWGAQNASLGCSGRSAWASLPLSPGAGSRPTVVLRAEDASAWTPVLQDRQGSAGVIPVSVIGPQPGPFAIGDASTAYFISLCPICGGPSSSSLIATTDGGATFSRSDIPKVDNGVYGISFITPTHGWLAADVPEVPGFIASRIKVLGTTDGGKTWSNLYISDLLH